MKEQVMGIHGFKQTQSFIATESVVRGHVCTRSMTTALARGKVLFTGRTSVSDGKEPSTFMLTRPRFLGGDFSDLSVLSLASPPCAWFPCIKVYCVFSLVLFPRLGYTLRICTDYPIPDNHLCVIPSLNC